MDAMPAFQAARFTGVPESRVYGVASFYAQFYLERQGRHKIKVCRGTACHVRGSARIMSALGEKLGIGVGETTPDYAFTLERVACFGSCALAPVVVVDDKVYGRMTPEKTVKLLDDLTLNVLVPRRSQDVQQARAANLRLDDFRGEGDPRKDPTELAGGCGM